MALTAIPPPVLDKLRKITYNFLWSGCKEKHNLHLCNWEALEKPKNKGGWGIRNIFNFNYALAANSLWCALTTSNIWSSVIKDKYLPSTSVVTWLHSAPNYPRVVSQTWRNLNKSAHWIKTWISWKPGFDHSIKIGMDRILGIDSSSYLSPSLITHLHSKNIHYLFQASVHNELGNLTPS